MFVRLLLLLLIALNVGVAGWLVFGHAPARRFPPRTDPGVPELKLLSEQPGAAHAGSASTPMRAGGGEGDGRCLRIGPFDNQSDTRDALRVLTPHVADIQFQQDQVTQSSGWWVYLPPLSSRDKALALARRLSEKGVSDYYVITAGDRQNTISLGLYHDPANARRREKQLVDLGFQPQLQERTETLPQYWVEIALPKKPGFDWHDYVKQDDVKATPVGCF